MTSPEGSPAVTAKVCVYTYIGYTPSRALFIHPRPYSPKPLTMKNIKLQHTSTHQPRKRVATYTFIVRRHTKGGLKVCNRRHKRVLEPARPRKQVQT